ncbi:MAG: LapA family protein [Candidatus Methylomirabilis sp.]
MNQLYLIGFLIIAGAIATFAIQNSGEAVVKFIGWQFQSSLVVVVLISTAVGVIMAVLLSLRGTFRLRARLREQAQRIAELEQQLRDLESKNIQGRP